MSILYRASFFLIFIFLIALYSPATAQLNRGNDTSYYEYFPGSITTRFYFSQKYTAFTLKSKDASDLRYLPNTTLNMGVGATYHNFSLNLAYGFPFLNTDDNKGKTKYLDLQGHFYTPATVIDFYGQLYKGYHLNGGFNAPLDKDYYYLKDARVNLFGLSYYHVFSNKRFSYRAALIQNEWQKKSAGSLLLGAEAYYGIMNAKDSTWVPQNLEANYTEAGINKINYFSIGPGVGYAYTLVIANHIYLTGSATGNLNFNVTTEHSSEKNSHLSVQPVTRWRAAAGYNGRVWNVSANWVADYLPFRGDAEESKYALQTGNYRFIIARRFYPGPKLKKPLRVPDAIFKE